MSKPSKPGKHDVTVKDVDIVLWRRVRVAQLESGLTMGELMEDILNNWLDRRDRGQAEVERNGCPLMERLPDALS